MEKVSLSNKVFTDNPLLDEIVYNARQLSIGTILKDSQRADDNETTQSARNGDVLVGCTRGNPIFEYFSYTADFLRYSGLGYSDEQISDYVLHNDHIPEEDRPTLTTMAATLFVNNYTEYNNYYRMLHGYPSYDSTGVWNGFYIDTDYIDSTIATDLSHITIDPPVGSTYEAIHLLSTAEANVLYSNGTLENIIENVSLFGVEKEEAEYLLHTGDRSVDYYTARTADKFALLYCPTCDSTEVEKRYKELLEANRRYLLQTAYSEAHKFMSEYYDNFMMIFIVIQTIIDMIIELPEYIIRRDIFDTRTCKYIFEANGVKYFSDIPLKYQISLVKNLNKLIKYKSTDKCIVDIVSVFGIDDISIFRYYILKDRKVDSNGNYYNNTKTVEGEVVEDNDSNYDLKFIKVPIDGKYDDYIRTDANIITYDTMTDGDDYWLGEKTAATIKSEIKDLDFTVLRSKYYSIEAVVDLAKRNTTIIYFMNVLMNNKINKSYLTLALPNVSSSKSFKLVDVIVALYSLGYIYYDVEDSIMDSRSKLAYILGFNLEADLSAIATDLYNKYNKTLSDVGASGFTVPDKNRIMSVNELKSLYLSNADVYTNVVNGMQEAQSRNVYNAYKYIYDSMMIMNKNMEFFMIDDSYDVVSTYKALGYDTKFINIPRNTGYTNPDDYTRDYNYLLATLKTNVVYFDMNDGFDTNHLFDLYEYKLNSTTSQYELIRIQSSGQNASVKMASTYREYLKYSDGTLHAFVQDIADIDSDEARRTSCVNAIQTITSYLKDYIGEDTVNLDDALAGLPSISLDFIKQYIEEVIDYFRSFKIFTHGSSIGYYIRGKFDNTVRILENISYIKYRYRKYDVVNIVDKPDSTTVRMTKSDESGIADNVWLTTYHVDD